MYWLRETYSEINYVVKTLLQDAEVNYWDIRTILLILFIPVIYLCVPLITFYARRESIKLFKENPGGHFAVRNKKNQEYVGVFAALSK
jgi:hypothetical protein